MEHCSNTDWVDTDRGAQYSNGRCCQRGIDTIRNRTDLLNNRRVVVQKDGMRYLETGTSDE